MKRKKHSPLRKNAFLIYLVLVISAVLIMNYYQVPATGYNAGAGQVIILMSAPICGDGVCGDIEVNCCTDCGCDAGFTCFANECIRRERFGINMPDFILEPTHKEVFLTVGTAETLYYYIENPNTVNIPVEVGFFDEEEMLSINQSDFVLKADERADFTVRVSSLSLDPGEYFAQVVAMSGVTVMKSNITITIASEEEEEIFPSIIEPEILKKAQFNLIWLIIPISAAIILFFYVYYKKKKN
jgi:hypothetical protein